MGSVLDSIGGAIGGVMDSIVNSPVMDLPSALPYAAMAAGGSVIGAGALADIAGMGTAASTGLAGGEAGAGYQGLTMDQIMADPSLSSPFAGAQAPANVAAASNFGPVQFAGSDVGSAAMPDLYGGMSTQAGTNLAGGVNMADLGAAVPTSAPSFMADPLSTAAAGADAAAGGATLSDVAKTASAVSSAAGAGAGALGTVGQVAGAGALGTVGQVAGAVAPIAGVLGSAYQASQAGNIAQAADPFRDQRAQYQTMLQQLMTNPSAATMDPSYQWRFNQGLEAVNRTAAAKGMLGSGNRLMDLTNYGQGMASTEYGNQFNRLAQLSGANIGSPAMAAQALYNIPQSNISNIFSQLGSMASPQYQQNLSSLWA